jgi:hypothetical protein
MSIAAQSSIPGGRPRARRAILLAGVAAWVVATTAAFGWIWSYEFTPGKSHAAPASVTATSGRHELLLFLHPKCPCTSATLAELARLTSVVGDRVNARVFFALPDGAEPDWLHTRLYETASAIPNVTVSRDPGGKLASRYGAATSGHAVLYAPDGRLAFRGGITASRGHEGDSAGASAILELIHARVPLTRSTPVFGCALVRHGDDVRVGETTGKVPN